MVRRVLAVVGLVAALLVGGLAPAAFAAPGSAAPAAVTVPGQEPPGGGSEQPPPPTCEPTTPQVPDPSVNYCSPRERVLMQVRAQLQRVAERVQNPRARAALQGVIARLR